MSALLTGRPRSRGAACRKGPEGDSGPRGVSVELDAWPSGEFSRGGPRGERAAVRSWNLAPAAPSPACTAAAAAPAAPAATPNPAAPAASAASTTPAANPGYLHVAANIFFIEEMERSKADVGHFLFVENEALIGWDIVRLRDIGGGHRGCGCISHQRKTQSGCTQCRHGGGVGCALLFRCLLHLWHGHILRLFQL
jgi:hypothetical protein